jgi:NAD(P)-dependent dehydrogenase (short-subunit alcohol dehydrogenase family)
MTQQSTDQFQAKDPREEYEQPDTQGREIPHPGLTRDMDDRPDHGEQTYRGASRLTGKAAIVTGGDSGIGRAVALAFAREGADVVISYLPAEQEDAKESARLVEEAGRRAVLVPGDLTQEAECTALVERAVRELGHLDVLVNNAAYQMSQDGGIEDITTEQLDRTMRTNLYAMFWLTKAALPHLRPGSTIVNSASVQAYKPSPHLLDYAMTKAAIASFTKNLGASLLEKGIRVNAVAPGPVWTPLIPATMDSEKVASFGEQAPMGRAAQPAELAPAYVFLASQESSFISGEVIGVTGGTPIS